MTYGTFHYVVANLGGTIIGVYGSALREDAFESARRHRNAGIGCEVQTKTGYRQICGRKYLAVKS